MHQILLRLLSCGLSLNEARHLSMEEVLCLLHCANQAQELEALVDEAARVAGLPFADGHEQARALAALKLRALAAEQRFYAPH